MLQPTSSNSKLSTFSLILANLIPIVGVLFFKWDIFTVLFLYWAESGVIGFYNILKIAVTAKHATPSPQQPRGSAYVIIPFFALHYGFFMYGHLIFLLALFGPQPTSTDISLAQLSALLQTVLPAVLLLFASHGVSFFSNFIKRQEYAKSQVMILMFSPYQRIILMHLTLILSGALVLFLNLPLIGLLVMIALKIITDFYAHNRSHTGGHRFFDLEGFIKKKLEEQEAKKQQ